MMARRDLAHRDAQRERYSRMMHYRRLGREDLSRAVFEEWNNASVWRAAGYNAISWRPRMAAWEKSASSVRLDGQPRPDASLTVYVTSWVMYGGDEASSGGFVWFFTLDEALDSWYGDMGSPGDRDAFEGDTARIRLTEQVVPFAHTSTRQSITDWLDINPGDDDFLTSPALRVRLFGGA